MSKIAQIVIPSSPTEWVTALGALGSLITTAQHDGSIVTYILISLVVVGGWKLSSCEKRHNVAERQNRDLTIALALAVHGRTREAKERALRILDAQQINLDSEREAG